jgi:hypothetical protein
MNSPTINAPSVNAPTIASSAVFIDLSISSWTGRKLDKRASSNVTDQANAARGVANVSKKLLGDCAELDAVSKFAANARNIHYGMTMPWSDLGLRICPLPTYMNKYESTMGTLQTEFAKLVTTFLDAYDWEISQAQLKLGSLFNADEYPTRDSLESKFKFRFTAMPMADAGDWRLDIGNEAQTVMKSQYETFYNEQLSKAMGDVWKRAHDALTKMSDRLDYADHDTKKIFRDSLVDNVTDIVEMMGACNLTNDPVMAEAERKLSVALRGVTPDALREDAYLRAETRRQVEEVKRVIDNLPSMGF